MSDRDPIWDALKTHKKEKFKQDRTAFMAQAMLDDDGGWTKHTDFHWSRYIGTDKLDYWPSRKKFQFRGKVKRGDVYKFIMNKTRGNK